MIETTVQYFNGKFALPYQVRIEVANNTIHLFDAAYNTDNGISFPLAQCHYAIVKEQAFIYLSNTSTDYIVVPKADEHYETILAGIKKSQTSWYHKLFAQKWYTLFLIVIFLIAFLFLILDKVVPPLALKFISVKQEIALGNQFYHSFTADSEIDSSATFVLQKFTDELQLSKTYPIKVTVVKDTVINAFALPGGHLVVYSGIIKQMEKPEELVALLSHEASHVNKRHSLKSIVSRLTMSLAISLVTADVNGLSRSIIQNVNMIRVLGYSRALEKEADDEGMSLMVNNHINPVGMKWLMEDLKKTGNDIPNSLSFLSTHPLTKERIEDADGFAKKYVELNEPLNNQMQSLWLELKKNYH